jgi:hypothetical protein
MASLSQRRPIDIALSTSLFKRSIPPQSAIDKLETKTRKRMEIAQKNYSSLNHDVFDSKHYQFTQSIKNRIKRIGAVAVSKIDSARNTYYDKAGRLAQQHQTGEITTEAYLQIHGLSLINADTAEALAYEEAIAKIIELTGLKPKYAGDKYDFSQR